jgi:hypothetical protein
MFHADLSEAHRIPSVIKLLAEKVELDNTAERQ